MFPSSIVRPQGWFDGKPVNFKICGRGQPLTSAVTMTLPALPLSTVRCFCCSSPAPADNRYLPPSRRSAANRLHAAIAVDRCNSQKDGRTDGRTLDRFIDPVPHTLRVVSKKHTAHYGPQRLSFWARTPPTTKLVGVLYSLYVTCEQSDHNDVTPISPVLPMSHLATR